MTTKKRATAIYVLLSVLLCVSIILALSTGAVDLSFSDIISYLFHPLGLASNDSVSPVNEGLFLHIRLPRVLLCISVGAALSVSGTLMQALFRNPIVEPGLIGTSSGAAMGAATVFVFGKYLDFFSDTIIASFILPLAAFVGALISTIAVYSIASSGNRVNVATMILGGIAVNAITASATGFLSYIARDPQARSITFWSLGTFSGANWQAFYIVFAITLVSVIFAVRYSKQLNAILLGESEATYLGIDIEKLKISVILINTLMVAVATAVVGVIGFIGLVVPHLLRMLNGADNRFLIIASALLGATMLTLTDTVSRIIIAPAELPIGVITAMVGAPVFIWMLIRQNTSGEKGGFYA